MVCLAGRPMVLTTKLERFPKMYPTARLHPAKRFHSTNTDHVSAVLDFTSSGTARGDLFRHKDLHPCGGGRRGLVAPDAGDEGIHLLIPCPG